MISKVPVSERNRLNKTWGLAKISYTFDIFMMETSSIKSMTFQNSIMTSEKCCIFLACWECLFLNGTLLLVVSVIWY